MAVASYGSVSVSVADDRRVKWVVSGDDEIRTLAIKVCGFLQNHPEYLSSGQSAQIATILGDSAYAMDQYRSAGIGCSMEPSSLAIEERIWRSYTITLEGCRALEQLIEASPVLRVVDDAECLTGDGQIKIIARPIEVKLGISRTIAATDGEDVAILRAHVSGPEAKILAIATSSWELLRAKTRSVRYEHERAAADQQRRWEREAAEAERLRIYNSPEKVAERAAAARRQAQYERDRQDAQFERDSKERKCQMAISTCCAASSALGIIGPALWATGAHHDPSKNDTAHATMTTGIALTAIAIIGLCSLFCYAIKKCDEACGGSRY